MFKIKADFPAPVVSTIIKHLYHSSIEDGQEGHGDVQLNTQPLQAFQAYSLVSRVWREQVQAVLFFSVNFTSMRRFMRLRPVMKTSLVVNHVRVLSLGIGQNYQTHVQGTELPDIMSMFPYLYELRLSLDNPSALPLRTVQQLNATSPDISALRLTLGLKQESPDFILQLLSIQWPLQYFSITQPHVPSTPWITDKDLENLDPPTWKLTEYRTDGFPGWEAFQEWVTGTSLATLNVLHMPPSPQNKILALVAPNLRSLNLVYDPNAQDAFGGMSEYPAFPELQELNLTNAILVTGSKLYQSIPMSVCHFGATMRIRLKTLIEIVPTIPMRMETVTIYHEAKMPPPSGWEETIKHYQSVDGRLIMRRRLAESPAMVPFRDVPRDDSWAAKRFMDSAVSGRVIKAPPTPPPSTPKLLRRLLSNGGSRVARALSLSKEPPSAFRKMTT